MDQGEQLPDYEKGLSIRKIAQNIGIRQNVVSNFLRNKRRYQTCDHCVRQEANCSNCVQFSSLSTQNYRNLWC